MPHIKLIARTIDTLPTPAAGQIDYWDAQTPGFGVRSLRPAGRVGS